MYRVCAAVLGLSLGLASTAWAESGVLLDWGGDVVQASTPTDRNITDRADDADNSSVRSVFFLDHGVTLSPAVMRGPAFHGGAQVSKQGTTRAAGLARVTLVDDGQSDHVEVYLQRPPESTGGHGCAALVWTAPQFAGDQPPMLRDLAGLAATLGAGNSFDEARWLIRVGDEYFLSATTFAGGRGRYTAELSQMRWLPYAPTRQDMAFHAPDDDATIPQPDRDQPLTAVGLYIDKDLSQTRAGTLSLERFEARLVSSRRS